MEKFEKLIPFTTSAEKHRSNDNKIFLVLRLARLLNYIDSVCDKILASPTVPIAYCSYSG